MIVRVFDELSRLSERAAGLVPVLVVVVGVAVVLAVLVAVRARGLVRDARQDRVRVAMIPTSSFDPSPEEVVRWAAQLARTNRVTGRAAPDGARMVRVSFVSVGEGGMVQTVSGPGRAESLLRQPGLSEVEQVDWDRVGERIGTAVPVSAEQSGDGEPQRLAVVDGAGGASSVDEGRRSDGELIWAALVGEDGR